MVCNLFRDPDNSGFSSFFPPSKIMTDIINFLCLFTVIILNAISIIQASALKMDDQHLL